MNKFKVNDKVRLNELEDSIWGRWAQQECEFNEEYVVTKVYDYHAGGPYIDMEGAFLTHKASQFELVKPSRIVIILRRGADDRSIRKALEDMGVTWGDGTRPTSKSYLKSRKCRALILYTAGKQLLWSSSYGLNEGARAIRKKEMRDGNPLILNTKPSVKETINELKRYF